MSRLRLAAACALLKLAQEPCYHEIITLEQYQLCALVINVRTSTGVLRTDRARAHVGARRLTFHSCGSDQRLFVFFLIMTKNQ